MNNTIRSGIATARIDRRKVLHHSAAGLAIPALAAAGWPVEGVAAPVAVETEPGSVETGWTRSTMSGGGFSPARLERMHEAMARHVENGRLPGWSPSSAAAAKSTSTRSA